MSDDLQLQDLKELAKRKGTAKADLAVALRKCTSLLDMLPQALAGHDASTHKKAKALEPVFWEVIDQAYVIYKADRENINARKIMAAGAVIGLVTEEPGDDCKSPHAMKARPSAVKEQRQQIAYAWLGRLRGGRRGFYNHEEACLRALLQEIIEALGDKQESRLSKEKTGVVLSPSTPMPVVTLSDQVIRTHAFIDRPEYRQKFSVNWNSGTPAIVFLGLPGIGKSELAQELTRQSDGSEALRIRFQSDQMARNDLLTVCGRIGLDSSIALNSDPRSALRCLLADMKAPNLLVLDDLESTDQLYSLLPPEHQTRIVATCRFKLGRASNKWAYIPVGLMQHDEAEALIRTGLPVGMEEEDVFALQLLSHELEGYPAGICRARELLVDRLVSPHNLLWKVVHSKRDFLSPLSSVLESIVNSLREGAAYHLLEVMSLMPPSIPPLSTAFLDNYLRVINGSQPSPVNCLNAQKLLLNLSLIRAWGSSSRPSVERVELNPIAQPILASVFMENIDTNAFIDRLIEISKTYFGRAGTARRERMSFSLERSGTTEGSLRWSWGASHGGIFICIGGTAALGKHNEIFG